jgi:queuosine precursor transporter
VSTRRHPAIGPIAVTAYAAAIVAANYLTTHYGLVPVGFGLTATAGIYCAGAALMLRNLVQDQLGRLAVVAAILAGAALSAITSPALALASGVAFGVSELVDTAVYTPLRKRGWARAVLPASLLGALIDTLLFLDLAGFPITTRGVLGQLVGKTWAVWLPVLLVTIARRARRAVPGDAVIS